MKTVTIDQGKGATPEVEAYLHGKFAVHLPTLEPLKEAGPKARYAVTHVATGLRITQVWGRAAARKLARALDAAVETDVTKADIKDGTPAWRAFRPVVAALVAEQA